MSTSGTTYLHLQLFSHIAIPDELKVAAYLKKNQEVKRLLNLRSENERIALCIQAYKNEDIKLFKAILENLSTQDRLAAIRRGNLLYLAAIQNAEELVTVIINAIEPEEMVEINVPALTTLLKEPKMFCLIYHRYSNRNQIRLLFGQGAGAGLLSFLTYGTDLTILNAIFDPLHHSIRKDAYAKTATSVLLQRAILNDNPEDLEIIYRTQKADLNALFPFGLDRPLTLAVKQKCYKAARYLCDHASVDPNLQAELKEEGRTALIYAVLMRDLAQVNYLAHHPRVNIHYPDNCGMTASHYASQLHFAEALTLLTTISAHKQPSVTDQKLIKKIDYSVLGTHVLGIPAYPQGSSSAVGWYARKSIPELARALRLTAANQLLPPAILEAVDTMADYVTHNGRETVESLLSRYQAGKFVMLHVGWSRHDYCVVLYKEQLILCNRGQGSDALGSLLIYKINPLLVTLDYIKRCIKTYGFYSSFEITPSSEQTPPPPPINSKLAGIKSITIPSAPIVLNIGLQKHSNCSYANPKSAIQGMLFLLKKEELHDQAFPEIRARLYAYTTYKRMTSILRNKVICDVVAAAKIESNTEDQLFYVGMLVHMLQHLSLQLDKNISRSFPSFIVNLITADLMPILRSSPQLHQQFNQLTTKINTYVPQSKPLSELPFIIYNHEQLTTIFLQKPGYPIILLNYLLLRALETCDYAKHTRSIRHLINLYEINLDELIKLPTLTPEEIDHLLSLEIHVMSPIKLREAIQQDNWEEIGKQLAKKCDEQTINDKKHKLACTNKSYAMHLLRSHENANFYFLAAAKIITNHISDPDFQAFFIAHTDKLTLYATQDIQFAIAHPNNRDAFEQEWSHICVRNKSIKTLVYRSIIALKNIDMMHLLSLGKKIDFTANYLELITHFDHNNPQHYTALRQYISQGANPNWAKHLPSQRAATPLLPEPFIFTPVAQVLVAAAASGEPAFKKAKRG